MELSEFLLARIAEDEDRARRAAFGWGSTWRDATDEEWSAVHADGKSDMVGCEDGDVTAHIARHDPARVLADCDAKRRIVAMMDDSQRDTYEIHEVLVVLALPYAAHPDYQPERKP